MYGYVGEFGDGVGRGLGWFGLVWFGSDEGGIVRNMER